MADAARAGAVTKHHQQVDQNLLIEAPSADYTCTQARVIVTHPAGTPQPQLDVLAASTLNGISNSWNPTLYTLTFTPTTGSANFLDFQTVLRTLNFTNPSKALSPNTRTIRYEVPLPPPPGPRRPPLVCPLATTQHCISMVHRGHAPCAGWRPHSPAEQVASVPLHLAPRERRWHVYHRRCRHEQRWIAGCAH